MTSNLVKSFNACLKSERHHSICTFIMEHIIKLYGMLVKHKEELKHWKGSMACHFILLFKFWFNLIKSYP